MYDVLCGYRWWKEPTTTKTELTYEQEGLKGIWKENTNNEQTLQKSIDFIHRQRIGVSHSLYEQSEVL